MNSMRETLMSNFELSIQFTESDTQTINNNGFVVSIVKGIHKSADDPKPLWVMVAPFEKNVVTWESVYGVYASPDSVQSETVISASSTQYPANPGVIYPFKNNVFNSPESSVRPDAYAIHNTAVEMLTFGLLQGVTVNGSQFDASPVNAVAIKSQDLAVFEPTETISVFLHKKTEGGTIIVVTEGPILTVDMASNRMQSIHYNGSEFVPGLMG